MLCFTIFPILLIISCSKRFSHQYIFATDRANLSMIDHESLETLMDRINRSSVTRKSGSVHGVTMRFSPLYHVDLYETPYSVPIYNSLTPIDTVKGRYLATEGQFIGV